MAVVQHDKQILHQFFHFAQHFIWEDGASLIFSVFRKVYFYLMNAGESLVDFFSNSFFCSLLGSTCSKITILLDILKNMVYSSLEQSQIFQY